MQIETATATTPTPALQRIGTQTDILGESPVWDDRTQCLYWVDIRRPAIRRLQADSGRIDSCACCRPRSAPGGRSARR